MSALLLAIFATSTLGGGLLWARELAETKACAGRLLDLYAEMLSESRAAAGRQKAQTAGRSGPGANSIPIAAPAPPPSAQ